MLHEQDRVDTLHCQDAVKTVLGTVHGDGTPQQRQASCCIRKYAHLISGIKGPTFILKVAITGCVMLEEKSFEILFFRGWKNRGSLAPL